MEDETNLAPAPEVEAEPVAVEPEVVLDAAGNPVEQEPGAEPEPEFADVEYEGKTYKVPPELKDAVLRQADYTRKTQEVADMRRQVETALQAVNTASQEERNAQIAIGVIDAQIADYSNIDWDAWEQSDPAAAQRGWRQFQQLQMRRNGAVTAWHQASQQRQLLSQQETAKRLEQGHRELAAKIPDWSSDKAVKLVGFGQEAYGFTADELSTIDDPRMIQVLHDAFTLRQQQKTKQVAQKVAPDVIPAAKVAGAKPAARPLDDRTGTDAWMKARNAQLARK